MKYAQDFDSILNIFILCMGNVALIYAIFRGLQRLDKEVINSNRCSLTMQACLCIISCEAVCLLWQMQGNVHGDGVISARALIWVWALSVSATCLSAACIMDLETCMVYNYVWWAGAVAVVVLMGVAKRKLQGELILFIALQQLWFCRMYGRADCHAFSLCAGVEAVLGMRMQMYLVHMLLAFGLLALVQGLEGNIGRDGNLKRPVAFLPYITLSFWGIILFYAAFRS